MDEAAFALLEDLAQNQIAILERQAERSQGDQLKLSFSQEVFQLRDLLDKARHEQKGAT